MFDSGKKKARDSGILDFLDALTGIQFEGKVWRVTRKGKDPVLGQRPAGRWDDGSFDVLYTSLAADGAISEIDSILSSLIPRPTKRVFNLSEIAVETKNTLNLIDMNQLSELGIDIKNYTGRDYRKSQAIGDATHFLGYDGLIVPNARWQCNNFVIFTERLLPGDLKVSESEDVDFDAWRDDVKKKRRLRIVKE